MSQPPEVQIAVLTAELEHVRKDMDEVRSDLRHIREVLSQAKGGWKTLMLVAGISSTIGALLAKVAPWFAMAPR
jgi:prefoldin subunit 5